MKIKREYIVLVVLIAGLTGYLVWQRHHRTAYRLPSPPKVDAGEIDRIEIDRPGQPPLPLKKTDDRWTVGAEAYAADPDKVRGMLDILETLSLTALVSEAGSYGRYDLDESRRIRVRAWSGDTLRRDLAVGKSVPTYRHTFVTMADDPNVYHAREDFRGRFDRSLDQLRDKHVLTFDREDIDVLAIRGPDGAAMRFTRQAPPAAGDDGGQASSSTPQVAPEPVWHDADGRPADGETIGRLLTSLDGLECTGYRYDRTKDEWAAQEAAYDIRLEGDEPHRLALFAPEAEGGEGAPRPGISSDNDYPFNLSAFLGDEIVAHARRLLGLEAEGDGDAPAAADTAG